MSFGVHSAAFGLSILPIAVIVKYPLIELTRREDALSRHFAVFLIFVRVEKVGVIVLKLLAMAGEVDFEPEARFASALTWTLRKFVAQHDKCSV